MSDKSIQLGARMLRLLLGMVVALSLLSAAAHIVVQKTLGDTIAESVPGRVFELLTVQTWLQAALIGCLLVLVSYFIILPMVRKVEERGEALSQAERQLDHSLRHDSLTGLPERHYLDELLDHSLARATRHGHAIGLLRLDLDGFRAANARLGTDACDQILATVAHKLRGTARASDYVARVGGDEFVVLVPEFKSVEGLGQLAKRAMEEITDLGFEGETGQAITCSIGIAAAWPGDEVARDVLMRRADEALADAQAEGGNAWRYHASAIQGMEDRLSVAG